MYKLPTRHDDILWIEFFFKKKVCSQFSCALLLKFCLPNDPPKFIRHTITVCAKIGKMECQPCVKLKISAKALSMMTDIRE